MQIEYRRICAWCHKVLGREYEDKPADYKGKKIEETHGICEICKKKMRKNKGT